MDVDGHGYRHASGPYHPGGGDPYQIYVFAELDESAAVAAISSLIESGVMEQSESAGAP
jgi:hypothetical protein